MNDGVVPKCGTADFWNEQKRLIVNGLNPGVMS